jgi:GH24 family phage-related lysozyme (muramidase)
MSDSLRKTMAKIKMGFSNAMISRVKDKLIQHEGMRLKAYDDATGSEITPNNPLSKGGNATIGVGHLIPKNMELSEVSQEWAEEQLTRDLRKAADNVREMAMENNVDLSVMPEKTKEGLINMSFQMGPKLASFKNMWNHLAAKNYKEAAAEALRGSNPNEPSKWAQQTPKRAKEVAEMLKG